MLFVKKHFLIFLSILVIYAGFFITHPFFKNRQTSVLGVSTNLFLFQEPQDGKEPILSALAQATTSIDMEVYLLSDKDIISSLISDCGRGVKVRVMLEQHPFGGGSLNQKTKQQLDSSCVQSQWTNSQFALTHEKTIVIDSSEVFILNQNLTASSFAKNREYDIVDANLADISEVEHIFAADWNRSSFAPTDANILVSPISSRDDLESLIASSTKTLSIEMEVIDDPDIIHELEEKASTVAIQLITPSISDVPTNRKVLAELKAYNISIKTIHSPYIHAKLIIADNSKAYVGSVNLTTQSMDQNREVGIFISQPDIVGQLSNDFSQDEETAVSF